MEQVLDIEEIRAVLYLDEDSDPQLLRKYQTMATSFVFNKTGFILGDTSKVEKPEQIEEANQTAKTLASLYLKDVHFSSDFNKSHDLSFGISSLCVDLLAYMKR